MKVNKVVGYLLLLIGLIIIFFSINLAYNIFTGKTNPPEIFKLESQPLKSPSENQAQPVPEIEIFPVELLNQGGNLGLQYMLIFLLIFAGGKVADLGIKMMDVKEK